MQMKKMRGGGRWASGDLCHGHVTWPFAQIPWGETCSSQTETEGEREGWRGTRKPGLETQTPSLGGPPWQDLT
jgi:hypothetical protein